MANTVVVKRVFTSPDVDPNDMFEWDVRTAEIKSHKGTSTFKQENVEVPSSWSQLATNVVASKYFYGNNDDGYFRENSVKQLAYRVSSTIAAEGMRQGLLDQENATTFEAELRYMILNQMGAFNSPVWFNVGLNAKYGIKATKADDFIYGWDPVSGGIKPVDPYERPQASACFILRVEDSIESIWNCVAESARLFKYGSGVGADWSRLRSSKEYLSGGGKPSGPVSFMKVQDTTGGTIKSGGKTRRAAIMQTLRVDHPDIKEFISVKSEEEKKAWALIEQGYDGSFNGPAYGSVAFQNVNQSVRLTNDFMFAVMNGDNYDLRPKSPEFDGEMSLDATEVMSAIADGTYICGDPGVQYEDTIQKWHTCADTEPIYSSNPCCFVGDTYIDTSEGRIHIDELCARAERGEELPYAFSYDLVDDKPVMRKINRAWKAGDTKETITVTTDKGVQVVCTPEHRFLTYDGEYVEAQHLTPGVRLRKLSRGRNEARSNRAIIYGKYGQLTKGMYQSRFIWTEINGEIPEGYHVHHINGDTTDDRLSNLELVEAIDHIIEHSTGSNNPRYIGSVEDSLIKVYDAALALENKTHTSNTGLTISRWNRAVVQLGMKGVVPMANSRIMGMVWSEFVEKMESMAGEVNDKILSTEYSVCNPTPVYDIEVQGTNNFYVSNGETDHSICVHNSEFMFLDNTACNLASLNLLKFYNEDPFEREPFMVDEFVHACGVFFLAQEILVDFAGYPSAPIAKGSHDYRPLGLGFANLGALIMRSGLAYDSPGGRTLAGAITALMTGAAYLRSADMADVVGPFPEYLNNTESFKRVMNMHYDEAVNLYKKEKTPFGYILKTAVDIWAIVSTMPEEIGFRNAQATVLAPTGTISFMMDCDTTGIEPDLGLVKYKLLAGAGDGMLKIVNQSVRPALAKLGYDEEAITSLLEYIDEHDTIEGSGLNEEDIHVFDCAFKPANGVRSINWKAHIDMMAACQPFISGAISKTVNMPEDATREMIADAYKLGWLNGLKAVAIYRENSKRSQPLSTSKGGNTRGAEASERVVEKIVEKVVEKVVFKPQRRKLPLTRPSVTHKVEIQGIDTYITAGLYADGQPGEIFIVCSKQGSTMSGLMDSFASSISIALQYGVPLDTLINKFKHTAFEPAGFTRNPEIPTTKSIIDYIFRWLENEFVIKGQIEDMVEGETVREEDVEFTVNSSYSGDGADKPYMVTVPYAGPPCSNCGGMTQLAGSCRVCTSCGTTTGCG